MFLPIFQTYSVCFSPSTWPVFLPIFKILPCEFLIFHVFQFSLHIPGRAVSVSHFPRFSVFSPYFKSYSAIFSKFSRVFHHISGLTCAFLIFCISVLSPYSRSYSMHFSFFTFFSVSSHIPDLQFEFLIFHLFSVSLTIFEVLQCAFLLFEVFQFSRHIPGPRLCISHVPRSSVFLVIF